DRFDLSSEREVLVGDAVGAVRPELDDDLRPADLEIGMMEGGLGTISDRVHEKERVRPARRLVLAPNPAVAKLPAVERAKLLRDLAFRVDALAFHGARSFSLRRSAGMRSIRQRNARPRFYLTAPPFARTVCPVMKAAAGERRKRASRATSSGVPQRPRGVSRIARASHSGGALSPHAVRIQPGARQFTRTVGARLRARLREKHAMPPFVAAKSSPLSPSM